MYLAPLLAFDCGFLNAPCQSLHGTQSGASRARGLEMPQLAAQQQSISPTIHQDGVRTELWDAVVIGAGVAGSIAAYQLARSGARVLLVDRATFPRDKVCGCCLNAHALRALEECGLAR